MFGKKKMDLYEDEQYEEEFDEIEEEPDAEEMYEEETDDEAYGEEPDEEAVYDKEADVDEVYGEEADDESVYEEEADADETYEDGETGEVYADDGMEDDDKKDYSEERSAKRVVRRKRRIRNQIIAYIVMLILVAAFICGAVYGGKRLVRFIQDGRASEPVEEDVPPQEVIEVNAPTVTPEPEPEPEVNPVDEVARYYIDQMTTEEKVAGLFFVTPESIMENVTQAVRAGAKTQEALELYAVGGLIYFGSNIQSAEQITEMLAGTQDMSKYPLFLGVDEEGGDVSRVASALSEVDNVGSARELGAAGDGGQVYL